MAEPLHEALHEAYDIDVAKLNRLAARSAERAEKLKAENEKLRGLLKDALPLIWLGNVDCSGCLHMCECYAGEATDFAPENCRLIVRAKELGIEVDG